MTVTTEEELAALKAIGLIVANTLQAMIRAARPGITTRELDEIGRWLLEEAGARSAPETCYDFPGATCISIVPDIAHGIPGERVVAEGDLMNIDVSAEKNGYFSDTGASFLVGPGETHLQRLCRDGKRALWTGIRAVRPGGRYRDIGARIEAFADKHHYTLIRNLASHGIGRSLHEEPTNLATWYEPHEKRIVEEGAVFTIEPFLSMGSDWAEQRADGWTLWAEGDQPTVQYEHTLVATKRGPVILTQPEAA